ncbi:MAG TPA: c-type cytochrome [Candidatus Paceibacterota bacterium]|jgi:cytochrome c553
MESNFRGVEVMPIIYSQGRRIIKAAGFQVIIQLAILTFFSMTGRADNVVSGREVEAKIGYCQDCHGPSGQGYHGYYPIPRLAGQHTEYLKNQLQAFIERRRTNNIMFSVAHVLRPAMIEALATKFENFNPKPVGGAPRKFVAAGKKIFEDGVPERNVAACAACHGPDATGRGRFPRLAGQLYPYVIKELTNWSSERGQIKGTPDTSFIMQPVAHSLTKPEIEAVAAYVSYLK